MGKNEDGNAGRFVDNWPSGFCTGQLTLPSKEATHGYRFVYTPNIGNRPSFGEKQTICASKFRGTLSSFSLFFFHGKEDTFSVLES